MLIQIVAQHNCRAETAIEIERQALEQREKITSSHITLEANLMKVKGTARTETTIEREIYFDGDQRRCDTSTRSESDIPKIRVSCFGCVPFENVAWISGSTGKREEPMLLIRSPDMESSKSDFIPPPAELGMIPLHHAMAQHFPMDAYLTRADRDLPTVEKTELDGVACFRISYTTLNMSQVDEWISAERGHSVIGIDERFQNQAGAEFHDSLRSTVELHEPSGIWFPVRLDYRRTINGVLFASEKVDISVHSLNTDLDPIVFSLPGIKQLSPGTRVVKWLADGEIDQGTIEWDGNQIVRRTAPELPPARMNRPVLLWANLAILLVFATLFFIRRYAQSHRTGH
jgi:hypothetical protein